MRRIYLIFGMIFTLITVQGCSKDYDDVGIEDPEAALFILTVENQTGEEVEIYLKGEEGNNQFQNKGIISPGENMEVPNLGVRQTYVVRGVAPGESVEDYFFEEMFLRTSPTDITVEISN